MGENTDQKNFEYGQFSRSVCMKESGFKIFDDFAINLFNYWKHL